MTKDKKTGIVSVNEDKCIGCMTCLAVCPIGCIKQGNIAYKCDLCQGEEPACVKNCPNNALLWLEVGGAPQVLLLLRLSEKPMPRVISQCLQRRLIFLIHALLSAIFLRARLRKAIWLFVSRLFIKQII